MKRSSFRMNELRKGTAKEPRSTLWLRKRQLALLQSRGCNRYILHYLFLSPHFPLATLSEDTNDGFRFKVKVWTNEHCPMMINS